MILELNAAPYWFFEDPEMCIAAMQFFWEMGNWTAACLP